FENHPFAAAEWPVIYRPVTIRSEAAQIMDSNSDESLFLTAPNNSEIERSRKKLREYRDDIELHSRSKSLIQIPQAFRQIHVDPALIQIDVLQVLVREWDQGLPILAIDFQNFRAPRVQDIRYRADVFIAGKNAAPFQLEGIKPTFFGFRQC